jgi:hypothetical protein
MLIAAQGTALPQTVLCQTGYQDSIQRQPSTVLSRSTPKPARAT